MLLINSQQARELDQGAQTLGIPAIALMEAAAAKAAVVAARMLADGGHIAGGARVVVLAGRGNNGGDGFALARHLRALGCEVSVFLCAGGEGLPPQAGANLSVWRDSGGDLVDLSAGEASWHRLTSAMASGPRLVVDAMLGIGQDRPPADGIARAIRLVAADQMRPPVLALDVPTGLNASTGTVYDPVLPADLTVTFGFAKLGLFTGRGREVAGRVVLAAIGLPPIAAGAVEPVVELFTAADAARLIEPRPAALHKGDAGRVLVVAGSPGMTGAAALAGLGALRGGAGLVHIAAPASARCTIAASLREALTSPLVEGTSGGLAAAASRAVRDLATAADAMVLGPGLGGIEATVGAVRSLVGELHTPLVLDADGLNAFAGRAALIGRRSGVGSPLVLTPHPGEAARLLDWTVAAVESDRLNAAREIARVTQGICLLKGSGTVIAAPEGVAYVIPAGNPAMATGGAGDVLAGLIAALWAYGLDRPGCVREPAQHVRAFELAALGAYLHAVAGDLAVDDLGPVGLRASDIADRVPAAVAVLSGREPTTGGAFDGVDYVV